MAPSNLKALTLSHNAIAAKKKVKRDQIKEIVFDDEARREFLTGFHKRKLAKAQAARARAKEREKDERKEFRREQRQALREKAAENAATVEKAYGALIDSCDAWSGITDSNNRDRDEEYEDEEILATVTVVEDFDPDTFIHGPVEKSDPSKQSALSTKTTSGKEKIFPAKKKTQKMRYETAAARKIERVKQRARRAQKAELAGGKAPRRSKPVSKRKGASKR